MNKFNVGDVLDQAEKEWGLGEKGGWYKMSEGDNKVRVLTPLTAYASHFKKGACLGKEQCPECLVNLKEPDEKKHNKPSVKFLCHVLDYKDNQIKIAQFPYSVAKALQTYQNDPDWAFDEVPMPYDIKIVAKGAGTKEVNYTVVASPKREALNPEILKKLEKTHSPEQVKQAMQNKRKKELGLEVQGSAKESDWGSPAFTGDNYPTDEVDVSQIPF